MKARSNGRARRKVRYAVIGLGYISQTAVLPAFRNAKSNSALAALVSGNGVKARKLARKYGVADVYSYDQLADCLAHDGIDAVYIALPNHLHRDTAVAAAQAGKHILCEKPLAVTEQECEEMIDAAKTGGVRLMTAYRLHFERANLKAVEVVQSGRIGEPRMFQSAFTMQVEDGNVRLEPTEKGGGPAYDIGIYCINAARYLFRDEPCEVVAFAATGTDRRFHDAPEMVSGILRFPGDRLASFTCSFGATDTGWYQIVGTKGDLRVDPAYETAKPLRHRLTVGGGARREFFFPKRDQFAPELVYFSDCILRGKDPEPSGKEGLADVRIIQALLESIRTVRPVRLTRFERRRRPSMAMEMRRPPVSSKPLVQAASPSGH